ncbi:Tubulin--tyrosine ligase [Exaiptasia diaphana]|nr:Tubulin--tyrosine ligase [Exaiptasia diaphana]
MPLSFVIVPTSITEQSQAQAKKYNATANARDEREQFLEVYNASCGNRNIWIGKSNAGAKGESIFISSDPKEILESIDKQHQAYVVQKYIEDPLLLDGQRKFDIRVWVLLDHLFKIHVFSEGVLRTSSEPYDLDSLSNMTSHLTNHCIQEAHSQNFGQYERGNEMFFSEFERFLLGRDGIDFKQVIAPQIHAIIKECLMGIEEGISTTGLSYHSFQLFGFDFMIDQKYKVWLLEVNGAPASASDLLPSISRQIVTAAIDPLFPPKDMPEQKDEMFGVFVQIN